MLLQKIKIGLLWLLTPFQKIAQRLGRSETLMDDATMRKLLGTIRQGDILLSHENQRLTSIFIKGFYDHAAIVSNRGTVIEAVGDKWVNENGVRVNKGGVREVSLTEWLWKKDYVAVIRTKLHPFIVARASENATKYIGRGYDYTFNHKNEDVYCSELEYISYVVEWPNFLKEIPEDSEILPQAYLDLCSQVSYLECLIDTKKDAE